MKKTTQGQRKQEINTPTTEHEMRINKHDSSLSLELLILSRTQNMYAYSMAQSKGIENRKALDHIMGVKLLL